MARRPRRPPVARLVAVIAQAFAHDGADEDDGDGEESESGVHGVWVDVVVMKRE